MTYSRHQMAPHSLACQVTSAQTMSTLQTPQAARPVACHRSCSHTNAAPGPGAQRCIALHNVQSGQAECGSSAPEAVYIYRV